MSCLCLEGVYLIASVHLDDICLVIPSGVSACHMGVGLARRHGNASATAVCQAQLVSFSDHSAGFGPVTTSGLHPYSVACS